MIMAIQWREKLSVWQSWLLVAFVFSLPISSAAPNILLLFMLLLWLLEADFARKWRQVLAHPLFFPVLAFALLYPLSLLWTEDMAWGQHMVERHLIYAFFPLLLTVARKEHLTLYFSAFIAAMTLSELSSYGVWFHVVSIPGIDPLDPAGFLGHWEYNPFLAFVIYLMTYSLLFHQVEDWRRWVFMAFIVTMTINMFITGGRIGQLGYFALMLLLFVQYFGRSGQLKKGILIASVGLCMVFVTAYQTSSLFQSRVDKAVEEIKTHDDTKTGSVNTRFIFWKNSLGMLTLHPWLGSGVGDLPQDYNDYVGASAPVQMSTFGQGLGHSQPHNQYLFELVSFGLLGAGVFVWLWLRIVEQVGLRSNQYAHWRQAVIVLTLLVMLTDSYLLVQAFSYWLVLMLALLWQPRIANS